MSILKIKVSTELSDIENNFEKWGVFKFNTQNPYGKVRFEKTNLDKTWSVYRKIAIIKYVLTYSKKE